MFQPYLATRIECDKNDIWLFKNVWQRWMWYKPSLIVQRCLATMDLIHKRRLVAQRCLATMDVRSPPKHISIYERLLPSILVKQRLQLVFSAFQMIDDRLFQMKQLSLQLFLVDKHNFNLQLLITTLITSVIWRKLP